MGCDHRDSERSGRSASRSGQQAASGQLRDGIAGGSGLQCSATRCADPVDGRDFQAHDLSAFKPHPRHLEHHGPASCFERQAKCGQLCGRDPRAPQCHDDRCWLHVACGQDETRRHHGRGSGQRPDRSQLYTIVSASGLIDWRGCDATLGLIDSRRSCTSLGRWHNQLPSC